MIHYISETHLATQARQLLTDGGWTVYPEIAGIDLVGVSPSGQVYAFECKLQLNTSVIRQCWRRLPYVNAAIALVPRCRTYMTFERETARAFGIGIWEVREKLHPFLLECPRPLEKTDVKDSLHPAALNHTQPGKASCRRWGKWDVLQERYVDYLRNRKSVWLREAIIAVEPELRGKRTPLRQRDYEIRCALILNRRWRKLAIVGNQLQLASDVD